MHGGPTRVWFLVQSSIWRRQLRSFGPLLAHVQDNRKCIFGSVQTFKVNQNCTCEHFLGKKVLAHLKLFKLDQKSYRKRTDTHWLHFVPGSLVQLKGGLDSGKSSNLGLQQRMKLLLWSPTGYPFGQFVYAPSIQSDAILFSLL